MSEEKIILFDSPEAAQLKSATGWFDRFGSYYRDDERLARWSGCTHVRCCLCGTVIEKNSTKCDACAKAEKNAHFAAFQVEKWDGDTPVVLYDTERYFFGESILDFIADSDPAKDAELRICKCKPHYLSLVSDDNWCDDLAEDGELPDAVGTAMDALNDAIRAAGPVSWFEDAIAIDVADLRARVNARLPQTA